MMPSMVLQKEPDANAQLFKLTAIGLVIAVIGGIIAGMNWPRTELTVLGREKEVGNYAAFVLGSLMGWAGSMMLFVGLIGYGVKLGRKASPTTVA
jgi:hypothetical protein